MNKINFNYHLQNLLEIVQGKSFSKKERKAHQDLLEKMTGIQALAYLVIKKKNSKVLAKKKVGVQRR